jgi:hypothetical protein
MPGRGCDIRVIRISGLDVDGKFDYVFQVTQEPYIEPQFWWLALGS